MERENGQTALEVQNFHKRRGSPPLLF